MPTEVKRNSTTLIFDLRDFAPPGEAKNFLLCLNENTYHVVFKLFQFYGYWTNRYTPNSDGDIWYKAEDEDAAFVRDMYDKGMEELQMSVCFDDLIEAINTNFSTLTGAIQALQLSVTVEPASPTITVETTPPGVNVTVNPASPDVNLTCAPDVNLSCNGGGGGGDNLYGGGPVVQPEPNPGQTTPGSGPGGYEPPESWPGTSEEYNLYKCQAANFLVDAYLTYVDTCRNNLWTIAEQGAFAFPVVVRVILGQSFFLTLLSPGSVPVLVGYIIGLVAGSVLTGSILELYYDYLLDNKEDFICDLFNAPSVAAARDVVENYIDVTGVDIPGFPGSFAQYHIDNMFTNSVLNVLFEEHPQAVGYEGSVDCNLCGPHLVILDENGTIEEDNHPSYVLQSVLGANGLQRVNFGLGDGTMCFRIVSISFPDQEDRTENPLNNCWQDFGDLTIDCVATAGGDAAFETAVDGIDIRQVYLAGKGDVVYTVEVTIEDC